ncbi:MAG: class I SAM-dependent methyltransferase [Silvanigrellales bacterium]|nr:class I SAM-dependent methyltransferase [Silvanigrellales bacterium]
MSVESSKPVFAATPEGLRTRLCQLLAAPRAASELSEGAVFRACRGTPDGLPGCLADVFGPLVVCTVYAPQPAEHLSLWAESIEEVCRSFPLPTSGATRPWILKTRTQDADGYAVVRAEGLTDESAFLASEDGLRFEVRCDVKHDFGLFPDAREARRVVAQEAKGRTVLNLFSYTCGFGLAALQGGAAGVCNVDASRDYLAWGKRNAALNGMDFRVIPETAQAFLRRTLRRREAKGTTEFDFIVADPPAFGVGRDADRLLRLFWPEMAELLVALAPARMVLLFNDKYFRERKAVEAFVDKKFGPTHAAEWIVSPFDKTGTNDPFYLPPHVVLLRAKGA